jgi:hypothetical protein
MSMFCILFFYCFSIVLAGDQTSIFYRFIGKKYKSYLIASYLCDLLILGQTNQIKLIFIIIILIL